MKILIAEDDPIMRQMVGALMSRKNIPCTIVEDGLKAVEAWEKDDFCMVFMDVQMPRMDGLEATRTIRQREQIRGGHTVIVAMTAYALTADREKCLNTGMDDYLSKPIDLRQFFSIISKYSC